MRNFRTTLALGSALALAWSAQADAQAVYAPADSVPTSSTATTDASAAPATQAAGGLEEIVVTAQKRKENLQNTPISITAISGAALEQKGRGDISELGQVTPNLIFNTTAPVSGASSGAVVFIRGIGQTDFQLTTDPGVGTYVDGVYVARSIGGVLDVLDLDRVEVLRGPQGTLFGRNTIGGAISLVSREPSNTLGVRAAVTTGSFNRADGRISIDGPITDTLRFSIVGSAKTRDGYVKGLLDNRDLGDINRYSARGTLLWQPTNLFKATLTLDGTRIREQSAPDKLVGISLQAPGSPIRTDLVYNRQTGGVDTVNVAVPPGNPSIAFLFNAIDANILGVAPYNARWITKSLDRTYSTGPDGTRLDIFGVALTLERKLPFDATIKSISAFRATGGTFNRDADGSPYAITEGRNFDYAQRQFSQELQLTGTALASKLKYVGGLYYFKETGHDNLTVTLPIAFGLVRNDTTIKNDSFAAYAQASYALTDKLGVTGGVRYTDDTKGYIVPPGGGAIVNGLIALYGPTGSVTPFFPAGSFQRSFENTSFHAGLDWKPFDKTLVYFSYSEGYKSGGFNTRYLVPVPSVISFDPELLTTYEIGVKWEGFDRKVRLNTSIFHSNYDNIQLTVYESGAPITRNSGSADINGLETELTVAPTRGLTVAGGLGYLDASYNRVPTFAPGIASDEQILKGTRLAKTPDLTINARIDYHFVLGAGEVRLGADYLYSSLVENDAVNSKFLRQPGYAIANASIGYAFAHDRYSVTGFVTNLSDRRIIESGDSNYSIGFHEANFNRPREFGVTLAAKF